MTRPITQSRLTVSGIDLKTPPLPDPPQLVTLGPLPTRLVVACVWWGNLYSVDYVIRLRNMVRRHLSVDHDFVCLTDRTDLPPDIIRFKPPAQHDGWWQKPGLFSSQLFGASQRILYLDLDIVVINSLDRIVSAVDPFCMIENFGMNKAHAAHNSSCMLWTPTDETSKIFDCLTAEVPRQLHGDQCWIWRVMREKIRNWPRSWFVSYKYERLPQYRSRTDETSVIVFHGKPKPHEVRDHEVVEKWQ